jgi:glutathione S-transferase
MKLHWSPKSPYVRKVMVIAHEAGVASQLQLVRTVVAMINVNTEIMEDNPLGKIPTLVLDDGRTVFDSFVICDYLDRLGGGPRLVPASVDERADALTRHALGQGLTDALILWRNELNRPAENQLPDLLSAFQVKVTATLNRLERDSARIRDLPFDIGHAAVGCALSYLDFRFSDLGWRSGRPGLTAQAEAFEARPSAQATVIPAEAR